MMQGCTALVTLMLMVCVPANAAERTPPSYLESPVFFELYPHDYGDPENVDLMPQGRISLSPLGIESIENFDWQYHARKDASWWNRMENFFYLCPLLATGDTPHRRFVNEWFKGWYPLHQPESQPNPRAWDGMTMGQRVMILTWILKLEAVDPIEDPEFSDQLVQTIHFHQQYLVQPAHFESNSNHGMWQSLGLLETTRVIANDSVAATALDRLTFLSERSVSTIGIHQEHSPGYHFTFSKWLDAFVPYIESLYPGGSEQVVELRGFLERMHRASYFLYDHQYRVPPIGDSSTLQSLSRSPDSSGQSVIFDNEAGFGIFKDPEGSPARRYVVFNIQNKQHPPLLPFHYHDDVLAVYYCDDGETILDDAGRYSYRASGRRRYVKSAAAHSTIVTTRPGQAITARPSPLGLADDVNLSYEGGAYRFRASMVGKTAERTVVVAEAQSTIVIEDRFNPAKGNFQFAVLWMIGRDVVDVTEVGPGHYQLTTRRDRRFEMVVRADDNSPPQQIRLVEGRESPMLGWRADGFEKLVPAKTIVTHIPVRKRASLTTTIRRLD